MKKFLPLLLLFLTALLFFKASPVFARRPCYEDCKQDGGSEQQCRAEQADCDAADRELRNPTWYVPTPASFGEELYGAGAAAGGSAGGAAGTSQQSTINDTRWINRQAFNIALSTACGLVPCAGSQVLGASTGQKSAAEFFAGSIDFMMQNRPASSVDYIAYMGKQLHVPGTPQVAYAATGGVGFDQLSPILPIWTAVRNLAYLVFAIIFVVVGLMIMFRVKIDPKTAANIQNALPKIIVALIVVTFSYAIAGFLIDLMYVMLALIVTLAGAIDAKGVTGATDIGKDILSHSIFTAIWNPNSTGDVSGWASRAVSEIVTKLLGGTGSLSAQDIVGTSASKLIGATFGSLAFVIVAVALVIAIFRTWLALLGAYANIILGIIFAPLWLMMDAIPGQNQLTNWLKNLLSNLISFPVVFVMLLVGEMIVKMGSAQSASGTTNGFVPPLLGSGDFSAMMALVGLGIILTIPATLKIVQELLKAPAFKYGTEWLSSTSAGVTGMPYTARFGSRLAGAKVVPGPEGTGNVSVPRAFWTGAGNVVNRVRNRFPG
ncbi:hypothetical protein HY440_01360 [Candidatus Microgenomates bacterium]|nr:hypothetical protein [Candidatus Microgenomates bacterium]